MAVSALSIKSLSNSGGSGSSGAIFAGYVTNGGSFPTTRRDGSALQEGDYVRPASTSTFPFTIGTCQFTSVRDKAIYSPTSATWMIDPGVLQDTSETPVKNPSAESIGGTSSLQSTINAEVKTAVNKKVDQSTINNEQRVYVRENGVEKTIKYGAGADLGSGTIPTRVTGGNLQVGTPTDNNHAASKQYVDEHAGTQYTAGDNIQISSDNKISATDTKYTAGDNVEISADNKISATDTTYGAGTSINIGADNKINATIDDTLKSDSENPVQNKVVDAALKLKVPQYATMPTASANYADYVCQFSGATSTEYTNGYFYKCQLKSGSTTDYEWVNINVQPAGASSTGLFKITATPSTETTGTIDKTADDIRAAYADGKKMYVVVKHSDEDRIYEQAAIVCDASVVKMLFWRSLFSNTDASLEVFEWTSGATDYLITSTLDANKFQFSTLPEPGVALSGKIYQYTGETSVYTQGHFYICKEDEISPGVYSWQDLTNSSGGYEPDDSTIALNSSSQLEIKDEGIRFVKLSPYLLSNSLYYSSPDPNKITTEKAVVNGLAKKQDLIYLQSATPTDGEEKDLWAKMIDNSVTKHNSDIVTSISLYKNVGNFARERGVGDRLTDVTFYKAANGSSISDFGYTDVNGVFYTFDDLLDDFVSTEFKNGYLETIDLSNWGIIPSNEVFGKLSTGRYAYKSYWTLNIDPLIITSTGVGAGAGVVAWADITDTMVSSWTTNEYVDAITTFSTMDFAKYSTASESDKYDYKDSFTKTASYSYDLYAYHDEVWGKVAGGGSGGGYEPDLKTITLDASNKLQTAAGGYKKGTVEKTYTILDDEVLEYFPDSETGLGFDSYGINATGRIMIAGDIASGVISVDGTETEFNDVVATTETLPTYGDFAVINITGEVFPGGTYAKIYCTRLDGYKILFVKADGLVEGLEVYISYDVVRTVDDISRIGGKWLATDDESIVVNDYDEISVPISESSDNELYIRDDGLFSPRSYGCDGVTIEPGTDNELKTVIGGGWKREEQWHTYISATGTYETLTEFDKDVFVFTERQDLAMEDNKFQGTITIDGNTTNLDEADWAEYEISGDTYLGVKYASPFGTGTDMYLLQMGGVDYRVVLYTDATITSSMSISLSAQLYSSVTVRAYVDNEFLNLDADTMYLKGSDKKLAANCQRKIYVQTTEPTDMVENDVWIQEADDTEYYYLGTRCEMVRYLKNLGSYVVEADTTTRIYEKDFYQNIRGTIDSTGYTLDGVTYLYADITAEMVQNWLDTGCLKIISKSFWGALRPRYSYQIFGYADNLGRYAWKALWEPYIAPTTDEGGWCHPGGAYNGWSSMTDGTVDDYITAHFFVETDWANMQFASCNTQEVTNRFGWYTFFTRETGAKWNTRCYTGGAWRMLADGAVATQIINNLTSQDPDKGLSAYQGKVLNDTKLYAFETMPLASATYYNKPVIYTGNSTAEFTQGYMYICLSDWEGMKWVPINTQAPTTVEDLLTSTSAANALSANQGRALKALIDAMAGVVKVKVVESQPTEPAVNTIYYVGTAAPYHVWLYTDDGWTDLGSTDIELADYVKYSDIYDGLDSTATNKALSANQGKVLQETFANYMPKAGGEFSGDVSFANDKIIYSTNAMCTNIKGGNKDFNGADFKLYGYQSENEPKRGTFEITSAKADGSGASSALVGKPDSTLTWAGNNVLTRGEVDTTGSEISGYFYSGCGEFASSRVVPLAANLYYVSVEITNITAITGAGEKNIAYSITINGKTPEIGMTLAGSARYTTTSNALVPATARTNGGQLIVSTSGPATYLRLAGLVFLQD